MKPELDALRRLDLQLEERCNLLLEAARDLPALPTAERERVRARVVDFLRHDVLVHLGNEGRILYPTIAERLGDPLAPAPLYYEHRAIRWWTDEIDCADITDAAELQRLLYGVHALIRMHLSREEDLYLAPLDGGAWPAVGGTARLA